MSWLQRWWAPLSAIAVIFVSVVIVVCFWDWLGGKEKGPSDIIRNTGLIVAAVVAIILAVWRSDIAQRQTEGASRSLREEQYKTAVEMLGNCQLFVRVGAIDTLTQLAETYPNDFHLRVVRLLAAFVCHPPNSSVSYLPYGAREETQRILVFIANRSAEGWWTEQPAAASVRRHGQLKKKRTVSLIFREPTYLEFGFDEEIVLRASG